MSFLNPTKGYTVGLIGDLHLRRKEVFNCIEKILLSKNFNDAKSSHAIFRFHRRKENDFIVSYLSKQNVVYETIETTLEANLLDWLRVCDCILAFCDEDTHISLYLEDVKKAYYVRNNQLLQV